MTGSVVAHVVISGTRKAVVPSSVHLAQHSLAWYINVIIISYLGTAPSIAHIYEPPHCRQPPVPSGGKVIYHCPGLKSFQDKTEWAVTCSPDTQDFEWTDLPDLNWPGRGEIP